jgi:hypothetical protein
MIEEWRPVAEYEGIYEVSDAGRVRRIARAKGARVGHILRPWKHVVHGMTYLWITLTKKGVQLKYSIHRLVWESFNGRIAEGNEVHHLDHNPSNNTLSNLREVSHKENMGECVKAGRQSWGERNGHCRLTCNDVADIRAKLTGEWGEITRVAREYGVTPGHISNIATGLHRKTDGGKTRTPRPRVKLTDDNVKDIRMAATVKADRWAATTAAQFGVSTRYVYQIVKGVYR